MRRTSGAESSFGEGGLLPCVFEADACPAVRELLEGVGAGGNALAAGADLRSTLRHGGSAWMTSISTGSVRPRLPTSSWLGADAPFGPQAPVAHHVVGELFVVGEDVEEARRARGFGYVD